MTGKMMAICILVLSASAFAVSSWNTASASVGDYTQDVKALERRIGMLEMAMGKVTKLVTKDAEGTMGFYRETRATIKRSSTRMDSLKRRMSELERQRADFEALNSRVADLETRISELERRQVVTRKQVTDTSRLNRGSMRSQRTYRVMRPARTMRELGRSTDISTDISSRRTAAQRWLADRRGTSRGASRVFVFHTSSQGVRKEIRYYTTRDMSMEDVRLPDYLVRGLECVRR